MMIIRQNKQNHPKVKIRNPKSHWKIGKIYSSPTYLQEPIESCWLDGPLEANEFVKETRGVLMLLWVHRGGEYLLLLTGDVRICITWWESLCHEIYLTTQKLVEDWEETLRIVRRSFYPMGCQEEYEFKSSYLIERSRQGV